MKDQNIIKFKQVWNWFLRHNNSLFYWLIFIALTLYIVLNWNACISMKFFDSFNGNNILFFCWILMFFLKIFRIKVKDVEIFRNLQEDLLNADLQYIINEYQQLMSQEQLTSANSNQKGEANNAQSAD